MTGLEDLPAEAVADLYQFYLSKGCPCRFPRFVALTRRELPFAIGDFTQQMLIFQFDKYVTLQDKKGGAMAWQANCASCGSHVEHWEEELVMSSWLDHLLITPAAGVEPLGAPVAGPIPRCCSFFAGAPGISSRDVADAELAYPRITPADWLAWLRAER